MKYYSLPIALAIMAPALAASGNDKDLITASKLPSNWSYVGCRSDNVSARVLDGATMSDDKAMTGENCIRYCSAKGYTYAGTEYAQECWCGTSLSKSMDIPDDCTTACTGDKGQACGGPERLTVYMNAGMGPWTNPGVNGYVSQGCYTDDVSLRTLSSWVAVDGGLSVAKCTYACKVEGYVYSGVEYAGECYCSNSVQNNAKLVTGDPATTGCNNICNGNITEYCGGASRLNLYKLDNTSEYVKDGDFELGNGDWQVTSNPLNQYYGNIYWLVYQQTTSAYSGTKAWLFLDETADIGTRSLCISQSINHSGIGTYNFSAAIGRTLKGSDSTDTIKYDVLVDGSKVLSGDVCNPSDPSNPCTLNSISGIPTYNKVEFTADIDAISQGFHTLYICATFSDVGPHDVFLIDKVSILGPKKDDAGADATTKS